MTIQLQTELSKNNNLSSQTENISRMFEAWDEHCGFTLRTLTNLRYKCKYKSESESVSHWVIEIGKANIAADLVSDLKEMTKKVPYNDKLVDMTDQLAMWFQVCPENHQLKHLFTD